MKYSFIHHHIHIVFLDCRLAAREVSAIKPILDSNNINLVGVGLEELGVQEFIDGKYFEGGVYLYIIFLISDFFFDHVFRGH